MVLGSLHLLMNLATHGSVSAITSIQTTDGDGYVDLAWESPVGGEEAYLEFGDGVLANAFYFFSVL